MGVNAMTIKITENINLHKDVQLKPTSNGFFDIEFDYYKPERYNDFKIVNDIDSLKNAVILSILTMYDEVDTPNYKGYGCRVRELLKSNFTLFEINTMRSYITRVIENIARIETLDSLEITKHDNNFHVELEVTSITGEYKLVEVDL